MYEMFCAERNNDKASYSTYARVFNEKSLAFHRPKKDQCQLCMSFRQSNDEAKDDLRERYERHISEKKKVREIKDIYKQKSKEDKLVLCATFDLQQVMYLPISNESALVYKRRLSNYNLTFYNITESSCHCFTWHEGQSGRSCFPSP